MPAAIYSRGRAGATATGLSGFDASAFGPSRLEGWVEQGAAPDLIIGTGLNPARTRPLCAYPRVARYQGNGNVHEAASFRCIEPRPQKALRTP